MRLLCVLLALLAMPLLAAEPDRLRVGVNGLPVSLGNPYRGNGRPGSLVWNALFDTLVRLDEEGRQVPALATRWTAVAPNLWRFELRPGVRFANGRRFDAAAAARTFTWLASPQGRSTVIGNELRAVRAARAAGPLTLEIETSQPDPILPKRLVAAYMVEPDLWDRLGPDGFALAPIGTGSFRLTAWDQRRRRAELVANPHAWRPPHVQAMTILELPDAAVRTQALLSQDVDLAQVELEETDRLRRRGYVVNASPSMSVMSVAFINQRATPGPLQSLRVRQALNLAVDKQALSDVLLRGLGAPSGQPAPRMSTGHDPAIKPWPHDPARARAMLAKAGYPQGFDLDIDIQINAYPADALIYQAVAHDLRQVGIRPRLRVITLADYLRKLATNGWTSDAFAASWNNAPYNDATRAMESFSCRRARPFFCDPELADELARVSAIPDNRAREAAMRTLSRGFHNAAPALFLVEQFDLFAHHPRVTNMRVANRVPMFEDIRLKGPPS
jgi:peptide/nickel transport system substrate-binding protein